MVSLICLVSLSVISQDLKTQLENAKKIYIARITIPDGIYYDSSETINGFPTVERFASWPSDIFYSFDDSLMAQCKLIFGDDKVEWWPDKYVEDDGRLDEKNVDCDF
jgi:hypothetical protein